MGTLSHCTWTFRVSGCHTLNFLLLPHHDAFPDGAKCLVFYILTEQCLECYQASYSTVGPGPAALADPVSSKDQRHSSTLSPSIPLGDLPQKLRASTQAPGSHGFNTGVGFRSSQSEAALESLLDILKRKNRKREATWERGHVLL